MLIRRESSSGSDHRDGPWLEPVQLRQALVNRAEHLGGDLADGVGRAQQFFNEPVGQLTEGGELIAGAGPEVFLDGPGPALARRSCKVAVFGQIRQSILDSCLLEEDSVVGREPVGDLACGKVAHQSGGATGEDAHDREILDRLGAGGVAKRGQP